MIIIIIVFVSSFSSSAIHSNHTPAANVALVFNIHIYCALSSHQCDRHILGTTIIPFIYICHWMWMCLLCVLDSRWHLPRVHAFTHASITERVSAKRLWHAVVQLATVICVYLLVPFTRNAHTLIKRIAFLVDRGALNLAFDWNFKPTEYNIEFKQRKKTRGIR